MIKPVFAIALGATVSIGCGPVDASEEQKIDSVQRHRGDPGNFTSSGFPRHVFPIEECETEIALTSPFEVVDTGRGPQIGAPLSVLEDPNTLETAHDGVDAQSRISFLFPGRYERIGMRELFARGGPTPLPLEALVPELRSPSARHSSGIGGDTRYVGAMHGLDVAVLCLAVDWPNPVCKAEVQIGEGHVRYLVSFPPSVAARLERITEIGNELFQNATAACGSAGVDSVNSGNGH